MNCFLPLYIPNISLNCRFRLDVFPLRFLLVLPGLGCALRFIPGLDFALRFVPAPD